MEGIMTPAEYESIDKIEGLINRIIKMAVGVAMAVVVAVTTIIGMVGGI